MEPFPLERLLSQARVALEATAGVRIVLSHPHVLKDTARSIVVRCRAEPTPTGNASVIIRHIKDDPARGFSDWAGLEFLSQLPAASGAAPGFLAGDSSARSFVTEDLGPGDSLQDILERGDPREARRALMALSVQMARLQAATLAREGTYSVLRSALPASDGLGREREAETWLDGYGKIVNWFAAVDRVPPPGLEACLERIASSYREPAGFLTFTHGDPAPTNNHFAHGRVRLVDFEYGGFRHALYDITAWNVLCPLPSEWVREMLGCFREELAKTLPAARDDARFAEAWADLCAYRALAILGWITPDALRRNRPWARNWTTREALLVALSRLREASATSARLAAVHEAADILLDALRPLWPEYDRFGEPLPPWAAVRTS